MTALVDGELSARRRARIERHLQRCSRCAAEAREMHATVALQQRALRIIVAEGVVDPTPLWAGMQSGIRDAAATIDRRWIPARLRAPTWPGLLQPAVLAGATLAVLVTFLLAVGGPQMVLIPLGVESPPPAITRQTELFKDYPLIEQLEALEHFDTVESVPLDDEQVRHHG
jgi:anti-sigma factor RsiW